MRTIKTCCCCGDKPCKDWDNEYRYGGGEANCPICALGTTTISATDFEEFAPYEPTRNQGDSFWEGRDSEGDGHPDNLHYGNLCWHPGEKDWEFYPEECEWNVCWNEYPDYFGYPFPVPESTFYQYDSPMGLLPWSPQAFTDWIDNWEGPLLPKGDCTMHCTLGSEGNLGCHKLAFVGAIGKNFGSQHANTDGAGEMKGPLCGSDIVTVPPPESDWPEIREWVRSGGKLIVMGESSGSPMEGTECKEKIGFFNGDSTYYTDRCLDDLSGEAPLQLDGLEVAELLRNFALYCAQQEDEEEIEEFFKFRDDEYYDEERDENYINTFEAFELEDDVATTISCCQRSKRPFLKRDSEEDPSKSFSFHCSSSSGLLPKGKGKGLVGHCNGEGCTVVWKPNGAGAVVVVYDSNVWGATNSQIPMSWWENETLHPEIQLDAETLKLRACNNDFWRFMCEDFLDGEMPNYSCTESDSYWDNKEPDNYTSENPCLPTAPCCLPNEVCLDDVTVWECFKHVDENGNRLPGIWHGPSAVHPSGVGSCDLTCGDITCEPQEKKLCCSLAEGCSQSSLQGPDCCLSEGKGFDGGNLVYKYECCELAKAAGYEPSDVEDMWTLTGDEYGDSGDSCDACYVIGACCYPYGCEEVVRQHVCEKTFGIFQGPNSVCNPDPCVGACCCWDSFECYDDFTEDDCMSACGEDAWQQAGSVCGDNDVICGFPTEGACCLDTGECTILTPKNCAAQGGVFDGIGSLCADVDCPQPGACCLSEGGCTYGLETSCDADAGDAWQGAGYSCGDVDCPGVDVTACCIDDGENAGCENCQELTDTQCDAEGGISDPNNMCADNPCNTSGCVGGACCVNNSLGECGAWGDCCCVDDVTTEECYSMGVQDPGGTQPNTFHDATQCGEVDCCGSCCCIDGGESFCLSTEYMWGEWSCVVLPHEECNGTPFWNPCDNCFCEDVSGGEEIHCESFGSCCISECFDGDMPVSCIGYCVNVKNEQECVDLETATNTIYYNEEQMCDEEDIESPMCRPGYCCLDDGKSVNCKDCSFENECTVDLAGDWTAYSENCTEDEPEDTCYDTDGTICDPDVVGGCCIDGTCHDDHTEKSCGALFGVWLDGEICFEDPYEYQCDPNKGTCCDIGEFECLCSGQWWCVHDFCNDQGGMWFGYVVDDCDEWCGDDGDPFGACCLNDCGNCLHITSTACAQYAGSVFYPGESCGNFYPCFWRGGCCFGDNCQSNMTQDECVGQGGNIWLPHPDWGWGPCTQCYGAPCGGTCCMGCCCIYCNDCADCNDNCWYLHDYGPSTLGQCESDASNVCQQGQCVDTWNWYYNLIGGCNNCFSPAPETPDAGTPDDGTPEIPQQTCPQECIDAGCECNCLNTRNGIVCL